MTDAWIHKFGNMELRIVGTGKVVRLSDGHEAPSYDYELHQGGELKLSGDCSIIGESQLVTGVLLQGISIDKNEHGKWTIAEYSWIDRNRTALMFQGALLLPDLNVVTLPSKATEKVSSPVMWFLKKLFKGE